MKLTKTILLIILFPFFMNAQPVIEKTTILADDGASDDMFGYSLSIQGKTAIMGTPQDDDAAYNAGAAYVYKRTNDNWNCEQKITATDGEIADMFGESVDIDGNYLIVGAYQAVGITGNTGAAYIYKYDGTNWNLDAKIFANDGESADNFGKSVAISNNFAVIGAPNEDYGTGAAYIFELIDEIWTQTAKITENDAEISDHFAHSVDIDGNYIAAGAIGIWEFQTKIIANDADIDRKLGYSVAISNEYVVAGSLGDNGGTGSAYIFHRTDATWAQQAKLTPSDGNYEDYFGKSVSISDNYVLIGSQRNDNTKIEEGAAYLFTRTGTTWTQQNKFTASDANSGDMFGYCVAISGDYGLISTIQDNGAVYVFGPEGVNVNNIISNISIYPNPTTSKITISNAENFNLQFFDTAGKKLFQSKINNNYHLINFEKYPKGVYIIQLSNESKTISKRIIKK